MSYLAVLKQLFSFSFFCIKCMHIYMCQLAQRHPVFYIMFKKKKEELDEL